VGEIKTMRRVVVIMAAMALGGCSSTLKPATLDAQTGHFSTDSRISARGIEKQEKFDTKYLPLLYVKTDAKSDTLNSFYLESFRNMGRFQQVLGKEDMEALVIGRGLSGKVQNISDLIGLKNLSGEIGPFLVVEPAAELKSRYNFEATLKAVDPQTGQTVLLLRNKAFNWAGLDKPLFYPLFNGFLDWTNEREITTER
jgi:hypothetical protein